MATSSAISKAPGPVQRRPVAKDATRPGTDAQHQREVAFSMAQLWDGTGFIGQAAVVTFAVSLAARILSRPLIFFSWHPLSQIFGLVLLVQSILVLQPTHTAGQKRVGQVVHASLNAASFLLFSAGFLVIYLNKERNNSKHFTSLHGSLGSMLTLSLWGQSLVGFTMWATPVLYGGEARARSLWKLHRAAGYVNFLLLLVTFCTAAGTGFVRSALKIESWVFFTPMALIAVGVMPRIHGYKLGLAKPKA